MRARKPGARLLFVAALACALGACANAQRAPRDYGLGRAPERAVLAAVAAVAPDGVGLPAGRGTAGAGEALYETRCANCHDTPAFPALWGGRGSLGRVPQKTVGSYWPYATTVYDYIGRSMPPKAPGSLAPSEIYALTAYVLWRNGIVSKTAVLDASSLPRVRMPNRDGFFANDGRPDT